MERSNLTKHFLRERLQTQQDHDPATVSQPLSQNALFVLVLFLLVVFVGGTRYQGGPVWLINYLTYQTYIGTLFPPKRTLTTYSKSAPRTAR